MPALQQDLVATELEDAEAIGCCQAGDRQAFAVLVARYQRRALHVALRLLRDPDDAQEAVQECFVRAFQRLEQFHGDRPFFPWFRTIVKNDCLKRLTRSQKHTDEDRAPEPRASGDTVGDAAVHEALGRLDDKHRRILLLKHVEGFRYDELAAKLDIPRGTVMSRLHAARARLRELLEEHP